MKTKQIKTFKSPFDLAGHALETLFAETHYWDKISEKVNWDQTLIDGIMKDMQNKALQIAKRRFKKNTKPPFEDTIKEIFRLKKEYLNDI